MNWTKSRSTYNMHTIQERRPVFSSFLILFPPIRTYFKCFQYFSRHEYIRKKRGSKCPLLRILWHFENGQKRIQLVFFLNFFRFLISFSSESVNWISKLFLIVLGCWNFRCGMAPPESTIDSEGFKGGTRGAPIMPRDAVSRTANVERTGRHKWVNITQPIPKMKYMIWVTRP